MRQKLILNDPHIGVTRVAGTTPQTAIDLRLSLAGKVRDLMMAHTDKDIIINGDLFDEFDIPMGDALAFHDTVVDWDRESHYRALRDGLNPPTLTIGRGNHDISKDSSRLSMFDFIGQVLQDRFRDTVRIVTEPTQLCPGIYMIPHAVNQDVFEMQLKAALDLEEPSYILLHANYDNQHAAGKSDHSLNVSPETAQALIDQGHTLIFGHEHQYKTAKAKRVVITGNQFPSSVADCLDNDTKYATVIKEDGTLEFVATWWARGSFTRIDWRDIGDEPVEGEFIRVEGECSAEEAAAMVSAVSKLRQKCDAFVVTNSVKVEGVEAGEDIKLAGEEMTGADVLNYLFEELEPAQVEAVKKLLQERE